jgi:hypothetical protein
VQVKNVKNTVFRQHKVELQDMQVRLREVTDIAKLTQDKLESVSNSVPTVCREMVNFYFDQRVEARLDVFAKRSDLTEALHGKLDIRYFKQYERIQLDKESSDDREKVVNEKFSKVERVCAALKERYDELRLAFAARNQPPKTPIKVR